MRKDKILTIGQELFQTNKPFEITEYDNCITIDNYTYSIDKIEETLLKIPATNCHEINEIFYYGEKETEYVGTPGITQPVTKDWVPYYINDVYTCLSEKDYLIPNPNTSPNILNNLVAFSATEAVLFYEEMVVDKSCNVPSPAGGEFFSTLCFDDDTEDNKLGITFFDFIFEGRKYSCLDDFSIEDDETREQIFEVLQDFGSGLGGLELYNEFTGSEWFEPTEYIESKRNRLIAFKSSYFHIRNFSEGERYTLNTSFMSPKYN